jgi:hypothetical protein
MPNKKQSSPKVAADAARQLPKKGVPVKKEKEFAGSVVSQAPGKKKK